VQSPGHSAHVGQEVGPLLSGKRAARHHEFIKRQTQRARLIRLPQGWMYSRGCRRTGPVRSAYCYRIGGNRRISPVASGVNMGWLGAYVDPYYPRLRRAAVLEAPDSRRQATFHRNGVSHGWSTFTVLPRPTLL
jgi:hypothetical protein